MFEKKNGKRFLASVMALVMLLSLAPVGALAADGETLTTEECSAMPLPAAEDENQQAVVNEDNNTPTPQPTKDTNSAEATKPEGGLELDESFSADEDDADTSNDIAEQNLGSNKPVQEQSITAEYWVTNRKVKAENSESKTIKSDDVNGATGKSVSELAPANGTCEDMDSVFWQARVLSGNDRQTMANNSTSVDKGVEITTIKYENNQFQYLTVDNEWKTFNSGNNEQLVFYYLIHTNFVRDVQINISDWPLLDNKDSQFINSSRFVRYEIYDSTENSDKPISQRTTWYNQARTISSVQVTMNENDEYRIDRIDRSYTYNNSWSGNNATSGVGSIFSIALNQNNNQYNAIVRIYVTKLRHELTVEYKKNTSDAPAIKTASKFYQLIDVNCENYFNSNFNNDGALKDDASVTVIGNQTISRDVAGYRFNHAVMSADKKTLTFYYDQLFKVTYDANGGTGNLPTEAEYVAGEEVIVASQGELKKTGYTFAGWKKGNAVVDGTTFTMPEQNVTLVAQWNASTTTKYTVKHFLQNLDGSYPTEVHETETKSGTTGENTAATAKSYTGFTAQSFAQKTIAANGSTVVEIKYERNKHNITYQITGDYFVNGSYTTVENVPFGSTLSLISNDMTKDGYTFSGWSGLPTTMPDNNVTVTGSYTKNDVGPVDPPTAPDTDLVDAMYFVLMPGQGVPDSGVSQGVDKYFPNASNNGGVTGKSNTTGYEGKITKAATELTGANTSDGYFNGNGVGDQYLKDIGNLGYFNATNYNDDGIYKGTLPTGMANFNMTNKSIVWYVIKKEGDVYHVDGYVKGVNIELKYFDEFNGQQIGETTRLLSGDTATIDKEPDVTHDGWTFAGWFTKDGTKYEVGKTYPLIDSLNLYARWTTTYDVVTHFMDADGNEKAIRENSNLSGVHGTPLKDMVLSLDKVNPKGISGNYVYVPSETSYSVGEVDKGKVGDATYTEANTVIHQYYYLDKTGKTDEKGKDTNEPNNYPDAWEYKATFIVKNGQWDTNPTGGSDTIVKYLPTKNITTGENIQATLSNVPTAGNTPDSHYKAGSWDPKPNEGDVITKDMTYTYTYSWRSSGGSGGSNRPKPPVVEIPDDVPTGLNGKDHYAYIIGYGNNDVRPQNNITRAEVATIFFRLLTDETREANMTKSNGYNDVKDGDWFCCAVSTLSKMGIIKGYEDGSFKPNDPISRAEFAAIAARFDPDGDKTPASFFDVTSHWAKDEISIAANHGWIKGYEDGSFKPDQKITRAETMTLVNRVLNRLPEAKDDLHKDMKTWVDNMDETAWYYLAVQEATNSHYFKNKTGTKFEQWTDLRDTRDWSELEK